MSKSAIVDFLKEISLIKVLNLNDERLSSLCDLLELMEYNKMKSYLNKDNHPYISILYTMVKYI